ncbi:hypothetical protein [Cryobacterium tagatosivorans]|uniref:Uncharacterized protein n=1 Tax=Cryobacterium tagatosivorans TaxID=1259199 RepID=A0A4V3I6B8_9MICO|nr:hypothetical protein [Cryobacterium tagatosivorans]TFB49525.1 hypothetical protein E3O23_11830 [Cryobacterium tagatosivorans]
MIAIASDRSGRMRIIGHESMMDSSNRAAGPARLRASRARSVSTARVRFERRHVGIHLAIFHRLTIPRAWKMWHGRH